MMENSTNPRQKLKLDRFERNFFARKKRLSCIGLGEYGGKAHGLAFIHNVLVSEIEAEEFPQIEVDFPSLTVVCTDVFETYMRRNYLHEIAFSDLPDDRIALAFQRAELPFEILGDLRALVEEVHTPLAVRSSSLLEDSTYEPFAGVYATKMIPNNQFDPDVRFQKLVEAIKFVYASTYFKSAKDYMTATNHSIKDEKMAVIIQEVVGKQHRERFYPELSGVARSYNYYPMGRAKYEDGVVNLALGLGKTIVDGGVSWTYSPSYPKVDPPYRSVEEMLKYSQSDYWAINMGEPDEYDPIKETEYLLLENIITAESDQTLRYLSSTYNSQSGRLSIGISAKGPRVITFAPLLVWEELPLNQLIQKILSICESTFNAPVEIEFAMTFNPHRFGFLQVRQMVVASDLVEIDEDELSKKNVLAASTNVVGNGVINSIQDVVYVKPGSFESKHTRQIAADLARINSNLVANGRPYMLIAIGRLGTTDPWLGIPIVWGQISGAKTIVEATQHNFKVELSQGSHYFHNLTSMGVSYFSVPHAGAYQIDWEWLDHQEIVDETQFTRHVKLCAPLLIKVDGRSGRGVIYKFCD
jgi:hypothetical protein